MDLKELMDNPCVSFWLKDAIKSALTRDPVDAANDAETLAQFLRERADRLLKGSF